LRLDELLFTYAPSARILEQVRAGVQPPAESLLAVADPQRVSAIPLPLAKWEVSEVASFAAPTPLTGAQATRDAVSGALDGHDVLQFACGAHRRRLEWQPDRFPGIVGAVPLLLLLRRLPRRTR
jgi:hypothetical protein